jgi:hypothetical protein
MQLVKDLVQTIRNHFTIEEVKEEISFEQATISEEEEEIHEQIDFFRKEVIKELVRLSYTETHRIIEDCYGDMKDLNRDFILEGQDYWLDTRHIERNLIKGEALDKATLRVYDYEKTYKEDLASYVGLYQSDNIAWGYLKLKMQKEVERLNRYFIETDDVEKNFPHIEILLPFADIAKPKTPAAIKKILSKKTEWKNLTVAEAFNDRGDNKQRYEAIFDELNLEYTKYRTKLKEYTRRLTATVNKYQIIFKENNHQDSIYKELYDMTISDLPTEVIKNRLRIYHNPKSKIYHKHGSSSSLMFYDDFEERRLAIIEEKRLAEEAEKNKEE